MRRRTFLGGGLAASVAGTAVSCASGKAASDWRFFTAMEARTVDAICERIIPADRDPGAREARVVHYIDIQLTGPFRKHQVAYRQGIARVDAMSRKLLGKPFIELPSEGQIEILTGMEDSEDAFFDLILIHARQGFYGDPRHGGNHNMVSWKMVGLPFPPVRGRAHYDDQSKSG
jgi:gluconate 2-dehydrogenase gamma chain